VAMVENERAATATAAAKQRDKVLMTQRPD
jgi:hypothetical protein